MADEGAAAHERVIAELARGADDGHRTYYGPSPEPRGARSARRGGRGRRAPAGRRQRRSECRRSLPAPITARASARPRTPPRPAARGSRCRRGGSISSIRRRRAKPPRRRTRPPRVRTTRFPRCAAVRRRSPSVRHGACHDNPRMPDVRRFRRSAASRCCPYPRSSTPRSPHGAPARAGRSPRDAEQIVAERSPRRRWRRDRPPSRSRASTSRRLARSVYAFISAIREQRPRVICVSTSGATCRSREAADVLALEQREAGHASLTLGSLNFRTSASVNAPDRRARRAHDRARDRP